MSEHYANDTQRAVAELKKENAELRERITAATAECTRSHPHELMTPMCELRAEIAKLVNQNKNLELQLAEEIRISNERGQHIEQRMIDDATIKRVAEECGLGTSVLDNFVWFHDYHGTAGKSLSEFARAIEQLARQE